MTTKENTKIYSNKIYLWLLILSAVLIAFDQLMKSVAVQTLKDKTAIVLIDGVLELRYLENQGAAFGILQNKQSFFTIITILFLIFALYIIARIPKSRYYLPGILCLTFLFSGAIGNFIDRTVQKYVVDFIYFSLIDFPIFNVADIYVSLSMIVLVILILFRYKEEDLDFWKPKGKKAQ